MTKPGRLIILPNLLDLTQPHQQWLAKGVDEAVAQLDGLIAESAPAGRRYLSRFETKKPHLQIPISVVENLQDPKEIDFYLKPMVEGQTWGLISDGGLPCLADPGSALVHRARALGIGIDAHCGPSSLVLALMLSGLPAQRFSFHGYPERESKSFTRQMKEWEAESAKENATQLFIQPPYKSASTLTDLLASLKPTTWLCLATALTEKKQKVWSMTIASWRQNTLPALEKTATVFLFYAGRF